MSYTFVTREELKKVWPIGEDLKAKKLVNRLFIERDACRKALAQWIKSELEISEPDRVDWLEKADVEVMRIMEGK